MRSTSLLLAVTCGALSIGTRGHAQVATNSPLVPLRVNVSLSDSSTPFHPVGMYRLTLFRSESDSTVLVTNEQGVARASIPRGEYRIVAAAPYPWHGVPYTWNLPVSISGDSASVDLSRTNAVPTPWHGGTARSVLPAGLGLEPGRGIRVRASTLGDRRVRGHLLALDQDSLHMDAQKTFVWQHEHLAIPYAAISSLEVSRKDYALGFAGGVALGVLMGFVLPLPQGQTRSQYVAINVAIGAIVGLIFPAETWHPVPLNRP